ncbi:MAG: NADPH-dependent glutamate synthase [Armatimonadetes bacterium]|nr:NADPH-dependent glutamate synthase [Armatimonadota bacterium]
MPEQPPQERICNFDEVPLGYDEQTALVEAERCLQCRNPRCVMGCPVQVQIPEFISLVRERRFAEASRKIKETNVFPAICGRVCPQETQCEMQCVLAGKGEPVAIGHLERFVADWEREHGQIETPAAVPPTGHRVAVIGSGPGGLACAADLAKLGHEVTVFELLHEPGGVLRYGIPSFRLPREVLQVEIDYVRSLGVEIRTNFIFGRTATADDLFAQGFHAIFIASGAGLPLFLDVPGENLIGVYSANEFLTRVNLMHAASFPEFDTPVQCGDDVIVVGAGNVAMDAARTARRLGADNVTVVYRRTRTEMPARVEEVRHAEEEGIRFEFLATPIEFLGDDQMRLRAARCIRMRLGEPDDSGRRRPLPVENSEFELSCDTAIIAIGAGPHPLVNQATPDLPLSRRGYIEADPDTGATSRPGIFAGGDIVNGSATVIRAMGAGRAAARAIDEYLRTLEPAPSPEEDADD